jgi:ribonucleotide reductase beta subunit family protein with ferritin-like domain
VSVLITIISPRAPVPNKLGEDIVRYSCESKRSEIKNSEITFTARDEQIHSDSGCLLFKELVKEVGITPEEEKQIYDGVGAVLDNELEFIDSIFAGRSIPKLDPEDLKAFIKTRYNIKMIELGLRPKYLPPETVARAQTISSWFYPMVEGASSNDFFAQSKDGNNYVAKISQNFLSVDFSTLDLSLPSLELNPA